MFCHLFDYSGQVSDCFSSVREIYSIHWDYFGIWLLNNWFLFCATLVEIQVIVPHSHFLPRHYVQKIMFLQISESVLRFHFLYLQVDLGFYSVFFLCHSPQRSAYWLNTLSEFHNGHGDTHEPVKAVSIFGWDPNLNYSQTYPAYPQKISNLQKCIVLGFHPLGAGKKPLILLHHHVQKHHA